MGHKYAVRALCAYPENRGNTAIFSDFGDTPQGRLLVAYASLKWKLVAVTVAVVNDRLVVRFNSWSAVGSHGWYRPQAVCGRYQTWG